MIVLSSQVGSSLFNGLPWLRALALEDKAMHSVSSRRSKAWLMRVSLILILAWSEPASARHPLYRVTDLGALGGTQSFAYAMNDKGQVVGLSRLAGDAELHAFLYSTGTMTDLSPLNSQDIITVGPTSINNAGQIASGVSVDGIYRSWGHGQSRDRCFCYQ
jgi:probable HAF family extracellular repeat protein